MPDDFSRTWVDYDDDLDAAALNDFEERLLARTGSLAVKTLTGVLDDDSNDISGLVFTPGTNTRNGIIFRRPSTAYGDPAVYGTAQAFLAIKEGTGSVHTDLVLARIDGRTGAAGFAGGVHSAGGLHKESGDATPTQNLWVQNNLDMVGVVINAYTGGQTHNLAQWTNDSGDTVGAITPTGVIAGGAPNATYGGIYATSLTTSDFAALSLGRGFVNVEAVVGVPASANQFVTGSAAGDLIIRSTASGSGRVIFGSGSTGILSLNASNVFAFAPLVMGANQINGVADPTLAQDAATKNYVDTAVPSGATYFPVFTFGSVVTGTPVANTMYFGRVLVLGKPTLTGIYLWNGGAVSGNIRVALYNSAGTRVADRTTNVAQAGANVVQKVPFDSTYAANPGVYYVGIMFDNTTSRYLGATGGLVPTGSTTNASFVTPGSITAPTSPGGNPPAMGTY